MEILKIYIKRLIKDKNARENFLLKFKSFVIAIILIAFISLISGQSPVLHNIQGYIFHNDGTQVQSGTKVRINSSSSFVATQTSGPPGNTGFYGTNINACDGELVIVTAFNLTAWGRNTTLILNSPSVTKINITLNNSRPGETDVNITIANNSIYDKFRVFNVTFNVTAIGGQNSINCNATISINNENIINLTSNNKTKNIGNITLGSTNISFFEVRALSEGTTNLNISLFCSSDGENFDWLNIDYLTLRVASQPPQLHTIQGYVFNIDNVTQMLSGTNVTINATSTGSFVSVLTSGPPGNTGFYSTTINARDGELIFIRSENATHYGMVNTTLFNSPNTTRINLSLNTLKVNAPYFTNLFVDDDFSSPSNEIDLTVAGTKLVNCSANVSDPDGFSDIKNVTAVFFDSNNATSNSQDDNNNHYTNSSCVLSNCSGTTCKADCTFNVWYYANSNASQSWVCNMTATDNANNLRYGTDNISINTLLGIEFPDSINFGTIGSSKVSNESLNNVTNRGNVKIDISLDGYGGFDGDGNAMNCSNGQNISIGYQKYNLTASNLGSLSLTQFGTFYKNLTDNPVNEIGFNLDYRKNDAVNEANKQTYWRIYVPIGLPINVSCGGKINIAAMIDL